jgi:Cation efflux family
VIDRFRHVLRPHSHDAADKADAPMEASAEGIRALWISLAVLSGTALIQAAVVAVSGSVALLGDTLHNVADALTAVPLVCRDELGMRLSNRTVIARTGSVVASMSGWGWPSHLSLDSAATRPLNATGA